jgi:hypothetical protein
VNVRQFVSSRSWHSPDPHVIGNALAGSLEFMPPGHRADIQIDDVEHGPASPSS